MPQNHLCIELSFQMQKKKNCNRIALSDVSKMPSPDVFGKKSLSVAGIWKENAMDSK